MTVTYLLKIELASFKSDTTQRVEERRLIQKISDMPWVNQVDLFRFFEGVGHTEPLFKKDSKAKTYDEEKEGVFRKEKPSEIEGGRKTI